MSGINTRGPWLKNPKLQRDGELICGGFFVFRRGDGTGRIRPSQWPFEYPTREAADAQAMVLAEKMPGYVFSVFQEIGAFATAKTEAAE